MMRTMAKKVTKELTYKQIPKEEKINGWVNSNKYLPVEYELVNLKQFKDSEVKTGWWTGIEWTGRLLPKRKYNWWRPSKRVFEY